MSVAFRGCGFKVQGYRLTVGFRGSEIEIFLQSSIVVVDLNSQVGKLLGLRDACRFPRFRAAIGSDPHPNLRAPSPKHKRLRQYMDLYE